MIVVLFGRQKLSQCPLGPGITRFYWGTAVPSRAANEKRQTGYHRVKTIIGMTPSKL